MPGRYSVGESAAQAFAALDHEVVHWNELIDHIQTIRVVACNASRPMRAFVARIDTVLRIVEHTRTRVRRAREAARETMVQHGQDAPVRDDLDDWMNSLE